MEMAIQTRHFQPRQLDLGLPSRSALINSHPLKLSPLAVVSLEAAFLLLEHSVNDGQYYYLE
jgi:hypothetical protein